MADLKFSCAQCGQHISCDELWSGQQIQCPTCQNLLTVPHLAPAPVAAAPDPRPPMSQPAAPGRPKLATGATSVARSTATGPSPQRRPPPRPPKTANLPLKYATIAILLIVVGLAAYHYLPGLLGQVQDLGASTTTGTGAAPAGGGLGPMGEVNGAMDVSDALDGSSPSKPRARAPRPPTLATNNTAAKPATPPARAADGQPAQTSR